MCGFVGVIDPDERCSPEALQVANDKLSHRGPDDQGIWRGGPIALAHRRLSIIDLSRAGHQPMISHDGRFVIAYNGEIYNFKEIRAQLTGIQWRGSSDTEVILEAIARWGPLEAVRQFNGMFAFALYDRQDNQLYLIRDRLGIKPLYYGQVGTMLAFGSELSALECLPSFDNTLDTNSIAAYFRFSYVPTPHSIYRNIWKLPPGHVARFSCTNAGISEEPETECFWTLARNEFPISIDESEAEERLLALLRDAVQCRMLADVPVGAFLSGGIDSSLICALMQEGSMHPIRTFSIGFEEDEFNEAEYARAVAAHLRTDHTDLYVSEREMLNAVDRLPDLCDEPFSDASLLPTNLVSQIAKRDVTVALSGDGGDELFWGYDRYQVCERIWSYRERLPNTLRDPLIRFLQSSMIQWVTHGIAAPAMVGKGAPLSARLSGFADLLSSPTCAATYRRLLSHWKNPEELVLQSDEPTSIYDDSDHWTETLPDWKRMSVRDLHAYLPDDILTKVDRASMAVSLEARVPLLDHRVVEYCYSLPESLIRRNESTKYLLRKLLARYVPTELTDRPKKGFGVPMAKWLRGPLRDWMEDLLADSVVDRDGILNRALVAERMEAHESGKHDWSAYLWDLLMFQSWLRKRRA